MVLHVHVHTEHGGGGVSGKWRASTHRTLLGIYPHLEAAAEFVIKKCQ